MKASAADLWRELDDNSRQVVYNILASRATRAAWQASEIQIKLGRKKPDAATRIRLDKLLQASSVCARALAVLHEANGDKPYHQQQGESHG
jgi:hypothetical protein